MQETTTLVPLALSLVIGAAVSCTGSDPTPTSGSGDGGAGLLPDGGVAGIEITQADPLSVPPSKQVSARIVIERHGVTGPIRVTATNAPMDVDVPAIVIPDGANEGQLLASAHPNSAVRRTKLTVSASVDGVAPAIRDLDFVVRGAPGSLDQTRSGTGAFPLPATGNPLLGDLRTALTPAVAADAQSRIYVTTVNGTCQVTRTFATGETDTSFGDKGTLAIGGASLGFAQVANDCNAIAVQGETLAVGGREFSPTTGGSSRAWVFRASLDGTPTAGFGARGVAFFAAGDAAGTQPVNSGTLVLGVGLDAAQLPRLVVRIATDTTLKTVAVLRFDASGAPRATNLAFNLPFLSGQALFSSSGDAFMLGKLDAPNETYGSPTVAGGVLADGTVDARFGASTGWSRRAQGWPTMGGNGGEEFKAAALGTADGAASRLFYAGRVGLSGAPNAVSFVGTASVSSKGTSLDWTVPLGGRDSPPYGGAYYAPVGGFTDNVVFSGLTALADGSVVVFGTMNPNVGDFFTMHFNANGSTDPAWGTAGFARATGLTSYPLGNGSGIAQSDGIVFAINSDVHAPMLVRIWI